MRTHEITRRSHIELGYKTYTGRCFTEQIWVDNYNRIQDRINAFIDAGAVVPDSLLDESHYYYRSIATLVGSQVSMDVIKFTGKILDGYNGHTASVVIVDIGTELRIYHAHGYYTTSKTPSWLIA